MSPFRLTLVVSLCLNVASIAALIIFLTNPSSSTKAEPKISFSAPVTRMALAPPPALAAGSNSDAWSPAAISAGLNSTDDIRALAEKLANLGLSREMAKYVVAAMIKKRMADYRRSLLKDVPYWQPLSLAKTNQFQEIQDNARRQLDEAFGPGCGQQLLFDTLDTERKYGVSVDKAALLQSIDSDYDYLRKKIQNDGTLSEEARRTLMQKLGEERLADIRATLSGDEYDAYQMRNSSAALQVREAIGNMNITENQMRQLVQQQQQFADSMYGLSPESARDKYFESQEALYEGARQAFGNDSSFFDYLQKNDRLYASLTEDLGTPSGLSPQTTFQLAQLQRGAAAELDRIGKNQTLSATQKAAARANLASQYAPVINNLLGPSGMEAYRVSKWGAWLKRAGGVEQ